MIKIYDSLKGQITNFEPENNEVKMYVCGPTVYDNPHLGHARCYITWDIVYRYLKFLNYSVKYCRNITDVDDKILNRSETENVEPKKVAEKYYNIFEKSMENLNILKPDFEPKATECINEMINMIKILIEKDYAYISGEDVYFSVKKFKKYGKLNKQPLKDLDIGSRIKVSEKKRDSNDFVLWKKDEKHGFDSPWGKGRPGWHIECSSMAKKYLGKTIDIHAGGQDLIFPHHENEIAQSEAANDCTFSKYWMHNGFVTIRNEKMSKSLNNFVSIDTLLSAYDLNTIRLFILTNHYRTPVEFNDDVLIASKNASYRIKNCIEDILDFLEIKKRENLENILLEIGYLEPNDIKNINYNTIVNKYNKEDIETFINAMNNDFNTSVALSSIFETVTLANKAKNNNDKKNVKKYITLLMIFTEILGFNFIYKKNINNELIEKIKKIIDKLDFLGIDLNSLPEEKIINKIIDVRSLARENKNWELADKLRNILQSEGIILKDSKNGVKIEIQ